MTMNRRQFLKNMGIGAAGAALPGVSMFAANEAMNPQDKSLFKLPELHCDVIVVGAGPAGILTVTLSAPVSLAGLSEVVISAVCCMSAVASSAKDTVVNKSIAVSVSAVTAKSFFSLSIFNPIIPLAC